MFPPPETLKSHPDYERVVDYLSRHVERAGGTASAIAMNIDHAAQYEYLTGKPHPQIKGAYRAFRDLMLSDGAGPHLFGDNWEHELTRDYLPKLARAAWMLPGIRPELARFLYLCESMMLAGTLTGTNVFTTLRCMTAVRWAMYGRPSAADVAAMGFGLKANGWGLGLLSFKAFDSSGLPKFDCLRNKHHAWLTIPAARWLYDNFNGVIPRAFADLPLFCLTASGDTFWVPGAENDYPRTQHDLGPITNWPHRREDHEWARRKIRQTDVPTIDWLVVPADEPVENLPLRPPQWSRSRSNGWYTIAESPGMTQIVATCPAGKEVTGRDQRIMAPVTIRCPGPAGRNEP